MTSTNKLSDLLPVPQPTTRVRSADANRLLAEDRAAHDWYRFVLSFPPHLVRQYLQEFEVGKGQTVLDPFCGTGTTPVECRKAGLVGLGLEINPVAHFASQTKTDWTPDPDGLIAHAERIADVAQAILDAPDGGRVVDPTILPGLEMERQLRTLPHECYKLLLSHSISPIPMHKTMVLLDTIERHCDGHFRAHERLALAKALVTRIGNLHFGPEVGVGAIKEDAPVLEVWLENVRTMANDLRHLHEARTPAATIYRADSRLAGQVIAPGSVDAVITSPPYPNEKDYTRTTRLESVLLGFINSKIELQALKHNLVRSNTRGVYKGDDDDHLVATHPEIRRIAEAIETRRIELGKTSGFERMYARVTKLYFGGMMRHFADLRVALKPGAYLAYVVGDQASYLRVMIRTGQLLAEIAESLGYEVVRIDLFRTRAATATREQLREEVVVLRWPGRMPS